MSERSAQNAEAIGEAVDSELLTDTSLLRRKSVLEYLQSKEQVQYLFVSQDVGMTAAKLLHPGAPRDLSAGDAMEKSPGRNYAAVMAITSHRVLYIIGGAMDDQRYSIDLTDMTATQRETTENGPAIATRNATLKFLFTPDNPADIDIAVSYLRSGANTASTGKENTDEQSPADEASPASKQTHKYSTAASDETTYRDSQSGSKWKDAIAAETNTSATAEELSSKESAATSSEQTSEQPNVSQSEMTATSSSDRERTAKQPDTAQTHSSADTKPVDTVASEDDQLEARESAAADGAADTADDDSETNSNSSAETEPLELPEEVTAHITVSQEALEVIESPFTAPDEAYSAIISAYQELCQALEILSTDKYPDKQDWIESQIQEMELLIEALGKYGPVLKQAQILAESAKQTETLEGETPNPETVRAKLESLQVEMADTSIEAGPIETLLNNLPGETKRSEDPVGVGDTTEGERGKTQSDHPGNGEKDNPEPAKENSKPCQSNSLEADQTAIKERFEASMDETVPVAESSPNPTVMVQLTHCYSKNDKKSVFTAVDPAGNEIWLVIKQDPTKELTLKQYYRFKNIEVTPAFGRESHRVLVTADSKIEWLAKRANRDADISSTRSEESEEETTRDSEPEVDPPTEISHTERIAHHLFVTDAEALSTNTWGQLQSITEKIHDLHIQEADILSALDDLTEIKAELDGLDSEAIGMASTGIVSVTGRVVQYYTWFTELKEILIESQRKISLSDGEQSLAQQDLISVKEQLNIAISLSQKLGRNTDQFVDLQEQAESNLNETDLTESAAVTGPNTTAPIDEETGIQANEISEYYDAVRNLKRLTSAMRETIDDVDTPMKQWCDIVDAFSRGEMAGYPCYGELQSDFNEFSISSYREVYGNGDRTIDFHIINTEPLTATVQHLLEEGLKTEPIRGVYLPVAPDSETRLPVIVETAAELNRAVALLKELPTSLSRAVSPDETNHLGRKPDQLGEDRESGGSDEDDDGNDERDGGSETDSDEQSSDKETSLTDLGGVTSDVAAALQDADITTRKQLTAMDMDELAGIDGVGNAIAQRIKMQVG